METILVKLVDDLRGIWRYRVAALIAAWVLCAAGWFAVLAIPNVYEASARVYLDTQSALRPLLEGLAIAPNIESELDAVRQAMTSGPGVETIARSAGVNLDAATPRDREAALAGFRQSISVTRAAQEAKNSDGVYRIAFRSGDRAQSLDVVKKLLDAFVEGTLGNKRTGQDDAERFLKEQIAEYEKRLTASEGRLADFKKANIGKMPTDNGGYFARLQTEMNALSAASSMLSLAEARRDELARQIEGEEPYLFGLDNASNQSQNSAAGGDVAMRIQELEKRREDLLLRFTPKHPEVTSLDRTLADLRLRQETELKRVRAGMKATGDLSSSLKANPVFQGLQLQAKQAAVQVAELRRDRALREGQVATLRRMVNSVPEVEAELARLDRDYTVTRTQYQALIQRLETAKLSNDADKTGTVSFKVIDPPTVPLAPISPKRSILLLGVLMIGIVGGVAVAFLMNLLRPVFFDWRAMAPAIGLPVIGHVQKFGHAGAVTAGRWNEARFLASLAGLVAAFVFILLVSNHGSQLIGQLADRMSAR